MKKKISKEEVLHVAHLARIELLDEEVEKFTTQLEKILEYMEKLNELDTENVEPTSHILNLKNVLREDKPYKKPLADPDDLIDLSPDKKERFVRVPKIIE